MTAPHASALRALQQEYKGLKDEPLEGFRVRLLNDDNLFDWDVAIFGPPGTIYQGGYFKARMHFPHDYPFSPPTLRFDRATCLIHPNVYESGDLCISILHPPVNDPQSGELPSERWNPTQSVRTILLSVVSLLNEPNTSSPANVDASVLYRRWKESNGQDNEYEIKVKQQVAASRVVAETDGVSVPTTLEEYVVKAASSTKTKSSLDISNFYDDDDDYGDENNDDDDEYGGSHDGNSSGNPGSSPGHSSGSHSATCPRDKKGGGESFEESVSDNEEESGEIAKKRIRLNNDSLANPNHDTRIN